MKWTVIINQLSLISHPFINDGKSTVIQINTCAHNNSMIIQFYIHLTMHVWQLFNFLYYKIILLDLNSSQSLVSWWKAMPSTFLFVYTIKM